MCKALNAARKYPVKVLAWRAVLLAALWWILVEGDPGAWGVGLVSVILALAACCRLARPGCPRLDWRAFSGFSWCNR